MGTLEDFVNVTITTVSQTPSQVGFGTPLAAAYHTLDVVQRVRAYSKLSDAVSDGIVSTGVTAGAHRALPKALSPTPPPTRAHLGRLAAAPTPLTDPVPPRATPR